MSPSCEPSAAAMSAPEASSENAMDARSDAASPLRAVPPAPAVEEGAPLTAARPARGNRRRLFMLLGAVVALAALLFGLDWLLVGSHHVGTDDAYVNADV